MSDGETGEAAVTAGDRAAMQHEAPQPLGWDGIAAILMLLVAAAPVRDWMAELTLVHLLSRVLWWIVYLAAAARLLQQSGTGWLRWTIRDQPALCVLLALTVVSSFWSLAPLLTLQRAVSLLGTTVVGLFVGFTCPPRRLMRVLNWTFTLVMLSSIAVALAFPETLAPGQPLGWRGIMTHKNTFGVTAVLATIFFLIVTLQRCVHPFWGTTRCLLCVCAVVQARSRTAFVTLAVCLVAFAYLAAVRGTRRPTRTVVRRVALALVLGVSVLPFLVGPLAALLGNDDPLNGRTRIWDGALTIFSERPLTGYGYGVVWGRADATLLPDIVITAHRSASNAHNGIVNVATELGIPAAIVACAYLFGALANAGRLFEAAPTAFSFFAFVFLIGFAVMSFSEAHLLQIHWMLWILFVALTVTVRRALNDGSTPPAGDGFAP